MAMLGNKLYFGTDESSQLFVVDTQTDAVTTLGICGSPTRSITSNGGVLVVDQGECAAWYTLDGLDQDGGNFGTTFFPNSNESVHLR